MLAAVIIADGCGSTAGALKHGFEKWSWWVRCGKSFCRERYDKFRARNVIDTPHPVPYCCLTTSNVVGDRPRCSGRPTCSTGRCTSQSSGPRAPVWHLPRFHEHRKARNNITEVFSICDRACAIIVLPIECLFRRYNGPSDEK